MNVRRIARHTDRESFGVARPRNVQSHPTRMCCGESSAGSGPLKTVEDVWETEL